MVAHANNMRILHLDIETTPALVCVWGLFKQTISIDQVIEPTALLCFAAKWHGEKGIIFHSARHRSGREYEAMVRAAHKLLSEADAVCHYNGMKFDIPKLNREFLELGLTPTKAPQQIDLWRTINSKFSFDSSKLGFVSPQLGIGRKIQHDGWPLWLACLSGDATAWRKMERYNRQDVALLEALYKRLLPWIESHPNSGHYNHNPSNKPMCTNCGSTRLVSHGLRFGVTLAYRRYQCLACGHWCRERYAVKDEKKVLVR